MDEDDLNDEFVFWQHMLEDWQTNNDEPVPERLYQALELARSKLTLADKAMFSDYQQFH